ncbi:MAG: condensation domain-containing protein [Rhodothermales bacterium]
MSKLENAIRNLTPEQRALLELRLKKKRQESTNVQVGIVQRSDTSSYPLSAGQRRLLSLEQLTPGTSRYNITEAYRLMGPLDVPALEASIGATLERHQVLRAAFHLENGTWLQTILDVPIEPLFVKNLSHLAATQRLNTALSLVRKDLNKPFALDEGHLIRARLIRLAANDHIFFITMHHLVCDAWSFDLLLKEIAVQYEGTINRTRVELPDLPIQYADFAAWQKSWLEAEAAKKQVAYWENEFESGIKPIILPTDKEQTASQSTSGASKRIILSQQLLDMLMKVSIEEKLTPFTLFLSAFKCMLYRYTGQKELVVCTPVAGRNRVEIESLVGYFNNLLVLRTELSDDSVYKDVTDQISKKSAEASDHQDIPFEVVAALPSLRRTPLTRSFFTFQNSLSLALQLPGMEIDAIDIENASADFDLAFYVEQKGEDIVVTADYKSRLFNEDTISALLANYVATLKAIADAPKAVLGSLPAFEMPFQHEVQEFEPEAEEQDEIVEEYDIPEEQESEPPVSRSITLTVNGASPSGDMLPLKAEPEIPAPMVAPADDIEQILTRIWERALGVSNIGVHDNFFDLGGHSLMAVDIFNEIQKYISDCDLPLAALLEAPTIFALAERIRNGEEAEWSPLVVIQPGRDTIPLFCMHGAGGNVLLYRDLAIQLGPSQTVYGLQSQGMDGMRPIIGRIEDMAALYVKAIRKAYPEGPYLLLGYCMGGTLALEIAQQLKAKGHEVGLLGMLETYNWSQAPKETFFSKIRYYFEKLEFHIRNYYLLSKTERNIFKSEKAAELQRRKKVWRGKVAVKLKPQNLVPKDEIGFNPRALAEVWRTNDEAVMLYEPEEYHGRIMNFIPMKEYSFHRHEGLGWEGIAHELETHVLSVFPAGMLVQPFVKELAQALRAEIYNISRQQEQEDAQQFSQN